MIAVLAPDLESGFDFTRTIQANGMDCRMVKVSIPARVKGDRLSTDKGIALAYAGALYQIGRMGFDKIAVACNTLQLWTSQAMALLGNAPIVYSTIEATCRNWHGALWLGTSPICRSAMIRAKFDVLSNYGKAGMAMQALTQETIWQAKIGQYGKAQDLADGIARLGVTDLILGCTELPEVFNKTSHGFNLVNPAIEICNLF